MKENPVERTAVSEVAEKHTDDFAETVMDNPFPVVDETLLDEAYRVEKPLSGGVDPRIPDAAAATFRPSSSFGEVDPRVMQTLMKDAEDMPVADPTPSRRDLPVAQGETRVSFNKDGIMQVEKAERPSFLKRLLGL